MTVLNPQIRRLTIDEYDSIIRVWLRAGLEHRPKGRDSREMISAEMARDHCTYFGLFVDNSIIGTGIANYDGRRGWVNRVAVDPEFRGQGLAGLLIESAESFLRQLGAVVICVLINDVNTPSMECFEKSGYTCEPKFLYFTKRDTPDS